MAQKKRKESGTKYEKVYNLEHEHLLSGILKCPVCGGRMYGNVNRKRKPDGTIYKDHFYYACKHRLSIDGHRCDYHKQWNQDVINAAVEEIITQIVRNPMFEQAVSEKLDMEVNTAEMEKELDILRKQLHQLNGSKNKLASQMDMLDVTDRHYDKKYQDMQERLFSFYDEIEIVEEKIESTQMQITVIKEQQISGKNVYHFLYFYDIMYKEFTDAEKKRFLNEFLESVEIFPETQPDGKILKSITFRFPVFYDGDNVTEIRWDKNTTVETVCLLSRQTKDFISVPYETKGAAYLHRNKQNM